MPEISYPTAGDELSDVTWRHLFGDQQGIIGDYDGSSYRLVLSTNSDVATLGSVTQESRARVAGFGHLISQTQTEHQGVTIPPVPAGSTQRTDVIALRHDPAYTGAPGPVRLVVIPGTNGSAAIPLVDDSYPGVQHEPLWAVTRRFNTALSQSTTIDLRRWAGQHSVMPAGATLPASAPLGSSITVGITQHIRVMAGTQPGWNIVPSDLVERITDLTRRTPHVSAAWGNPGGYGPVPVPDGNWTVMPGSAVRVQGCIKGHLYQVNTTFTTIATGVTGVLARMGLVVSVGQPTNRLGPGAQVISQYEGWVSASPGMTAENTMPTTLTQHWLCTADGDFWFHPSFACNVPNGYSIRNQFASPFIEITDTGPMTVATNVVQAGG